MSSPVNSTPLLQLRDVTKHYASGAGTAPVAVLQGVSLELARGARLAIVGPSGCGKSTLLNLIGTLDRATSGQLILDGEDLSRLDDLQLARVRNQQVGFVFQSHHLLPQCTVLENVLVPTLADSDATRRRAAAERARPLLQRVGLADRLNHRPGQLSGGERQRVAVVRALINGPKLLLADEPTGALDRQNAEALAQLLLDLNREQQITLIVVTHAPDLARKMDRVVELRDGRVTPQ